jgi:hypothetical protein
VVLADKGKRLLRIDFNGKQLGEELLPTSFDEANACIEGQRDCTDAELEQLRIPLADHLMSLEVQRIRRKS